MPRDYARRGLIAVLMTGAALAPLAGAHAHVQNQTDQAAPAPLPTPVTTTPTADAPPPVPDNVAGANAAADRQVYLPADFTRFAPKTALDMVEQVPGFTITGVEDSARGLGQARQNVLINGQRVSGKSNDAATALARIDSSAVVRIEIADAATLNVPGLSGQVANVVVNASRFTANFKWTPIIRERLEDNLFPGEISANGKIGSTELTIGIANDGRRQGHWGPEIVTDAAGMPILRRDELASYHQDAPRITGSLARTAANGNILNLNGAFGLFNTDYRVRGAVIGPGSALSDESLHEREREWAAELGGDYEFALGGGRLKLIGLQRMEHSPISNRFVTQSRAPGAVPTGNRFDQTVDEGESILRGEYRWRAGVADWQISLEGAYNTLDSTAALYVRDASGVEQPVPLDGASARVTEKRAEAILTYGRPLSDSLTLQASVGAEYSNIAVSGADGGSRQFVRPKGSLNLSWVASPTVSVNAKIERRVDQLSFYDFLASVNVADDVGNANNPDLVPPERWRGELEVIVNLGDYGTLRPVARAALVEGLVDQVPLSPTEEGRGNLPTTRILQAGLNGTLLFDPLGWTGARLTMETLFTGYRVRDPLTGEPRKISGYSLRLVNFALRHDIPGTDWAWGGEVETARNVPQYRLDQIVDEYTTRPALSAFVEHKNILGLTVRAAVENLLDQRDAAVRTVYVDRRDGPIAFVERREREFGRIIALTISGKI